MKLAVLLLLVYVGAYALAWAPWPPWLLAAIAVPMVGAGISHCLSMAGRAGAAIAKRRWDSGKCICFFCVVLDRLPPRFFRWIDRKHPDDSEPGGEP